jgi:hypothetical protein
VRAVLSISVLSSLMLLGVGIAGVAGVDPLLAFSSRG